jgi:hypothetical protein
MLEFRRRSSWAWGGLNKFFKDGPAGNRLSQSNTSPAGTVFANILFPVSIASPGGFTINIAGFYGSDTFLHQSNPTTFPGFQIGTTATNNIAGGIELGHVFPMTQSMVYTLIGVVDEHQHFFINMVTSENANIIGLQTGGGAAWMTPWPGVSVFVQAVENIYGQHTNDGAPVRRVASTRASATRRSPLRGSRLTSAAPL